VQDTAGRLRQLERVRHEANVAGDAATPLANAVSMLRESLRAAAPIESAEMATRTETALRRWDAWVEETKETLESPSDPDPDDGTVRANEILALLEGAVARRAESARGRAERLRLQEESERVRREIRHAARALDLASATYATFNRVKNEEIQRIFDELRADLARYYDFLHPGEGHGALAITMDPRKRGSSDLKMDFFERHEEDPRAYGSEGHLDSLGLCIFLAFVTRFNGQWPLLVLDDVVTSVDANHKRRVADLLFREFGDRQLFITTHDARWFNDLRKAQEETGQAARTRNLVAESWTVENGPQLRATA
jgi:hypothetical protein